MRTIFIMTLTFVAGFLLACSVYGQKVNTANANKLAETVRRLRNGTLDDKEVSFDQLMRQLALEDPSASPDYITADSLGNFLNNHPDETEDIKLGLINLLVLENESPDLDRYPLVIDAVASLNDERTIPALMGALVTGGMAQSGIIKYGKKALEPLLEDLKNPNALQRSASMGTVVTILKRGGTASRRQVKELLQSSFMDTDSGVRTHAVLLVECLPDRQDYVPALQRLSTTDPAHYPGKGDDGIDGDSYYPVRVQAKRVLRAIQSKTACAP